MQLLNLKAFDNGNKNPLVQQVVIKNKFLTNFAFHCCPPKNIIILPLKLDNKRESKFLHLNFIIRIIRVINISKSYENRGISLWVLKICIVKISKSLFLMHKPSLKAGAITIITKNTNKSLVSDKDKRWLAIS